MRFLLSIASAGLITAAAASVLLYTPDAAACGGCFPPQGEQASVVTDHRMILTVSQTQSTLYDQIKYAGAPSEFAWILPISGTVDVGLSADSLFNGLDTLTSVVVTAPPTNCPGLPASCLRHEEEEGASFNAADAGVNAYPPAPGVQVIKEEVVGPYETVQLHPTSDSDTAALEDWLAQHNFAIADDIKPVIAEYVKEHFNFLALRLQPGKDVSSMRPVRVTTQGANVALPLRMVAAGTGATVGITLWVLGQGRYEPANFGAFAIKDEEITWDWATNASNYKDLRAQKEAVDPGKLWEVESVTTALLAQIQSAAQFASYRYAADGGVANDYLPVESGGVVTKTAADVQREDYDTLFAGLGTAGYYQTDLRITRLRADLAHAALVTDLTVKASVDQSDLSRTRVPKIEKGEPLCPVYRECVVSGQLPRSQAVAATAANSNGDEGCSSAARRADPGFTLVLGVVAVAIGRSIRKRRRDR